MSIGIISSPIGKIYYKALKVALLCAFVLSWLPLNVADARVCFLPTGQCDQDVDYDPLSDNCMGYNLKKRRSLGTFCESGWTCYSCDNQDGRHWKCTANNCDPKYSSHSAKSGPGWEIPELCCKGDIPLYYNKEKSCPSGSSISCSPDSCHTCDENGHWSGDNKCIVKNSHYRCGSFPLDRSKGEG